jgi:hypothetical protein
MDRNLLSDFAAKAVERNRISFGDVQRLRRSILPDGLGCRAEAEALLSLDRKVGKADPAWERWLVATLVDFVVWAERPTGVVDEDTALWLAAALSGGGSGASRRARLIAREIAEEAHAFEHDALAALARIAAAPARPPRRQPADRASVAAQL